MSPRRARTLSFRLLPLPPPIPEEIEEWQPYRSNIYIYIYNIYIIYNKSDNNLVDSDATDNDNDIITTILTDRNYKNSNNYNIILNMLSVLLRTHT